MKKFLFLLLLGLNICACSQKESNPITEETKPASEVKTENQTKAAAQPYYFSTELQNALLNCTPYSEDIYAKNPDMKKDATSMLKMVFGNMDDSSFKLILEVKGKQEDKCHVFFRYDYPIPDYYDYDCVFSDEDVARLIIAMNDKSTEKKKRTFESGFVSMTMYVREYDAVFTELTTSSCKVVEKKMTEEEIKNMQHKMLAFSDKFKNSLKNCTPDTEVLEVMGMEANKVKIKGKEKGKCHVVLQGFHILLNDDELSLSGFDELGELVSNESRATYSPSYKYQGTLFSLSECEQKIKSNYQDRSFLGRDNGKEEISLSKNVKITRGVSSQADNICNVNFTLKMTRNGKTEDHSLKCELTTQQLTQYLKPYTKLIAEYGPKIDFEENGGYSYYGGKQTAEVSKADQELFLKLYKDGICKK